MFDIQPSRDWFRRQNDKAACGLWLDHFVDDRLLCKNANRGVQCPRIEVVEIEELKYPPNSIGFGVAALEAMYDLVAPAVPMSDARPAQEGNKSTTRMLCELSALRWTAGSSS